MPSNSKHYRSKFFRVAVEGDTVDGRTIERGWIEDMAASYNPATYGARVWLEHIRGTLPDGPFKAYGDVVALKAEEVEIDGKRKLALLAQIEPTGELRAMVNTLKQKIYTSIEVATRFAGTGKAYLMGLAVTDTPASLGTERLAFTARHPEASPLTARKHAPDNLLSAASEASIEFDEYTPPAPSGSGPLDKLLGQISALLTRNKPADAPPPAPAEPPVAPAPALPVELGAALAGLAEHLTAQQQRIEQLSADAAALRASVEATADPNHSARPVVTGAGTALTDC